MYFYYSHGWTYKGYFLITQYFFEIFFVIYQSCSEIRKCTFNAIRTKKLKKIMKNVDNKAIMQCIEYENSKLLRK